jgi:hypothetical protein
MPRLTTKRKLASRRPPLSVVILAVPPVEQLDLVGPLEVFATANFVLGERGPAYDIRVVSSQPKPIIAGECGVFFVSAWLLSETARARGHAGRRWRTGLKKRT